MQSLEVWAAFVGQNEQGLHAEVRAGVREIQVDGTQRRRSKVKYFRWQVGIWTKKPNILARWIEFDALD